MSVIDILSNPNLVLRMRLVAYGVLIFFSFFIFVGVAVMKGEAGFCILYLDVSGRLVEEPSDANCIFPVAISIIFQLCYSLSRMVMLFLLSLHKISTSFVLFTDMMELAYVVTDFCAFFLTFIGACILSAGTNDTCDTFKCDGTAWYSASKAAQAGAWISTFGWLFIFVVGFISLWRAGKIPFLGGGAAATTGASGGPADTTGPPMETPPNNPDDMPKY
ncbi:transmembrane protein 179 isoform X1 [Aplysia californica]|uniref:Transmembrane protein 179 isoform X1 n=1 Tax=Aplysia californica TaxID=6500 RepID=A0ABM1VZC1_APLCA|nr:transmembrane protein 179 isoform X1 [Aplysia californica]XP_035827764.1 transmembrane protein 179 isoform X1 [Aplysia californica]